MSESFDPNAEYGQACRELYALQDESLKTQRILRHFEDISDHGEVENEEYAELMDEHAEKAREEANEQIERFLDQAETFYDQVSGLVSYLSIEENDPEDPEYRHWADVSSRLDEMDRGVEVDVKSFDYEPGKEDELGEEQLAHGTQWLVHQYENVRETVEEHYEPMLDEEMPSLVEGMEDIERDKGEQLLQGAAR
ncbi:MAG: hypothetical protein ABEK01_04045 [Candidatus Nanohaloarchaea archaeon]